MLAIEVLYFNYIILLLVANRLFLTLMMLAIISYTDITRREVDIRILLFTFIFSVLLSFIIDPYSFYEYNQLLLPIPLSLPIHPLNLIMLGSVILSYVLRLYAKGDLLVYLAVLGIIPDKVIPNSIGISPDSLFLYVFGTTSIPIALATFILTPFLALTQTFYNLIHNLIMVRRYNLVAGIKELLFAYYTDKPIKYAFRYNGRNILFMDLDNEEFYEGIGWVIKTIPYILFITLTYVVVFVFIIMVG